MTKHLLPLIALGAAHVSFGQVTTLFTDNSSLSSPNTLSRLESDGSTYVVDGAFDGSSIFGSGQALRIADLSATDKPEVVWRNTNVPSFTSETNAFRIDMKVAAQVINASNDINLRFGNAGASLSSKANAMTTVNFQADGVIQLNGSNRYTFSSTGSAVDVSLVFNLSETDVLNFTLFDSAQTLAAQSMVLFVNGTQIGSTKTMDFEAATGFDLVSGVGEIGFIGESDSKSGPDYVFDEIVLYQGSDISTPLSAVPEPSSFALIFGLAALGTATRRRRSSSR